MARSQDTCKFLHGGGPNGVPQQQLPPQQQQQMPPQQQQQQQQMPQQHHQQQMPQQHHQQQAPSMMMMQGMAPMQQHPQHQHGNMEAMQAYAAQAQEMANQYALQAQAFAQQVAQAQAQQSYHPQGMPMGGMGMTPMQPDAGFMPMMDPGMMDPGFGPMGPQFAGQPSPMGPQYGAAMPGAQEQAILYAQKYVCTPTPPKRRRSPTKGGSPRKTCDFFARDGYCLHEANCKFEHVRPEEVFVFALLLPSLPSPEASLRLQVVHGYQPSQAPAEATPMEEAMLGAMSIADASEEENRGVRSLRL
jgi:hypothetical protein